MYANGVEAFLAVVQTSSISGAARQLNLSQSTISKRLKLLEDELQVSLFERDRGARSIGLTEVGVAFLPTAERWVELWQETKRIRFKSNPSLNIGSLDSLNHAVLPPLYKAMSLHQPRIYLQVITAHSRDFYEMIAQRQVDVAFSFIEDNHPSVDVEFCYSDPMVCICLAGSELAKRKHIHSRDLDPNFEIYVKWSIPHGVWHDARWPPYCHNRIDADTTQLILSFFYDERQWTILPYSSAVKILAKGGFSMLYLEDPPPERVCYKLAHKNISPNARAGVDILNKYLSEIVAELHTASESVRRAMSELP